MTLKPKKTILGWQNISLQEVGSSLPTHAIGTMPSKDLFMWFQEDLTVLDRWVVSATNHQATSEEVFILQ